MHKKCNFYPLSLFIWGFCIRTSRTSGIYPEHEGESAAQLLLNKDLKTFSSMEKKIIPLYYFSLFFLY